MDTLGSRQDFLATNEDIVTVGEFGVVGVGHGVEWTDGKWILVHDEEVSIVLFFDNVSKLLFVLRTQVVVVIL